MGPGSPLARVPVSQPAGILAVMPTAVLQPRREPGPGPTRVRRPPASTGRSPAAGREHPAGDPVGTILDCLRGDADHRPAVDPGLAGGLRAWLEDGVVDVARSVADGASVLVGPRGPGVADRPPTVPTVALARGAMVGALFRQIVVTGRTEHAVADAMAALGVAGTDDAIVTFVEHLPGPERAALAADVRRQAATMVDQWSTVPAAWAPRTGEPLSAPLAGGRVVLHGRLDLVLGGPSEGRASVCLVDVRSGERRAEHGKERRFHALLETLRSGAQPFRAATYYPASGEVDMEDVTEGLLASAVQTVIDDLTVPATR
jgi:hypothetical protein